MEGKFICKSKAFKVCLLYSVLDFSPLCILRWPLHNLRMMKVLDLDSKCQSLMCSHLSLIFLVDKVSKNKLLIHIRELQPSTQEVS